MFTRRSKMRASRRLKDSRGSNLIEAAMVMPLVLLTTFGIVDFASLFYVYTALENGVSLATRYAVTGQAMPDSNREESIIAAMREATPTLTIPDDAFEFEHMPVGSSSWEGGVGDSNEIGRVRIVYDHTLFTPVISWFFDEGQITLTVESVMKNERFDDEESLVE